MEVPQIPSISSLQRYCSRTIPQGAGRVVATKYGSKCNKRLRIVGQASSAMSLHEGNFLRNRKKGSLAQDSNDNNAQKDEHLFSSTEDFVNAGFVMSKEDKHTLTIQRDIFLMIFSFFTVMRFALEDYLFHFSMSVLRRADVGFGYITIEGRSFAFSSVSFVIRRFSIPGAFVAIGPVRTPQIPTLFVAFGVLWVFAKIASQHPYFTFFVISIFSVITSIPFYDYLVDCYSTHGCSIVVDASETVTSLFWFHNYVYFTIVAATIIVFESWRHENAFWRKLTNSFYYLFLPFGFFAQKMFWFGKFSDEYKVPTIDVAMMNPVAAFSLKASTLAIASFSTYLLATFKARVKPLQIHDWTTMILPLIVLCISQNIGLAFSMLFLFREYFHPNASVAIRHDVPASKLQVHLLSWFLTNWFPLVSIAMACKIFQISRILIFISMPVTFITNILVGTTLPAASPNFPVHPWSIADDLWKWTATHKLRAFFDTVGSIFVFILAIGDSSLMPYGMQEFTYIMQKYFLKEIAIIAGVLLGVTFALTVFVKKVRSPLPNFTKVFVVACFGLLLLFAIRGPPPCKYELGQEYIPNNADSAIAEMNSIIKTLVETRAKDLSAPAERAQHGKAFGCLQAEFKVYHHLGNYSTPLFKQGKTYPAYIRLSSSLHTGTSDKGSVVNGFAVKLLNVSGTNLIPDGPNQHTQDILFISHPVFFTGDVETYPSLVKVSEGDIPGLISWVFPSINPFKWRLDTVGMILSYAARNQFGLSITNPLNWEYFSTTPYRFVAKGGEKAVKYYIKPCEGTFTKHDEAHDLRYQTFHEDSFLRDNMVNFLKENDACFEFYIQEQEDACTAAGTSSVEDPTRPWWGSYIRIGTLKIPSQQILYDQFNYCENMSFNPWHSVAEHKPLGAINYARKPAYMSGAETRQELNHVTPTAPAVQKFDPSKGTINVGNTIEYEYASYAGFPTLPKYIKKMLPELNFNVENIAQMVDARFNYYMIQSGKGDIKNKYNHFQTLDDYAIMFGKPGDQDFSPPFLEHSWKLDEVFAKQFIAGINPLSIIAYEPKIRDIPKVVNLTKANIDFLNKNVLQNKTTLDELKSKRRLFFADYEILDGITRKDNRLFYSPVVLFYLNENDVLMPLAIQLTRNQTNNRLYTPADRELVWLFARMFAMESDGLYHEMVQHLCFTHLTVETIIIGMNRQLSADHPILKLMEPHFYNTIAINDLGRNTLLAANSSTFDRILACGVLGGLELMNKAYVNDFNLSMRAVPVELESRGFPQPTADGKDNLPGYLYRDDALRIWYALKHYVVSVLELPETYNGSDANVAKDFELQGLRRELTDPNAANVPGVPTLNTIDSLADFLTTVLFMASAEHSAVNFGQYDFYSFIPNRPLILTKPMPDDLSMVTNQYILSAFPTYEQAQETISTARVLSLEPEVQIGVYTGKVIGYVLSGIAKQVAYPKQYAHLVDDLNALQDIMKTRNAGIQGPVYPDYSYLEPIRIASSIAV